MSVQTSGAERGFDLFLDGVAHRLRGDREFLHLRADPGDELRVLLSLDMAKTADKGKREDKDHAVAWIKTHGKGRVFYSSLGHKTPIFENPMLMQFYLDGIQFATGDLKAPPAGP